VKRPALAAAAVVCALAAPALAHAHPRLVSSTPASGAVLGGAAPTAVELRFNEDVDPVAGGITVIDPAGHPVATGRVVRVGRTLTRTIAAARPGTYLVEWLAVGGDTHPARGAFIFSLGEQTRSGAPGSGQLGVALQALGRWLSLAGFALGYGVVLAAALLGQRPTRRLWRLAAVGIVLMIAAEPVSLLGQTATLQPSDPFRLQIAGDVLLTSYGHVAGLRLGGALALWALAGAVRQSGSRRLIWAIPAVGAALALVHADAAHRVAGLPSAVSLSLAAVHIAAAAAWLGLVVVALAGPWGLPARLVRGAVASAGVLGASGVGLAVGHLTAFADLARTAYGAALLVKLAVVALAFVLGAAGRRRAELVAAAAVLAAATVLVSLLPPR